MSFVSLARPRTAVRRRSGTWRDYGLALGLVLAAGAAVHGQHVYRNFHRYHWEDWRFMRYSHTELATPLDCFVRPEVWPGLYRPVSDCYYLLARPLFQNRVEGYHVVNAVLFVSNALVLFAVARRLLPMPWAFVPPALFASRAADFQVLLYTSEIQALLSTFFALLSIRWFLSERSTPLHADLLSLSALFLGLLSKESVVVVPAILTVHCWLFTPPGRWRRLVALWALIAAWTALFVVARQLIGGGEATGFTYDLSWRIGGRYVAYVLTFFNGLVWPIDRTEMVSRIPELAARVWVVALVAAVGLGIMLLPHTPLLAARTAVRTIAFGLWWFGLGMAPFVVLADRLFMRYTYFGHAGLAIAVAGALWLLAGTFAAWRTRRLESLE